MKIKHTEKIEKEIEITFPIFKREHFGYSKITEDCIIRVQGYTMYYTPSDSMFFEEGISDLLKFKDCSEQEFNENYEIAKKFHNGK